MLCPLLIKEDRHDQSVVRRVCDWKTENKLTAYHLKVTRQDQSSNSVTWRKRFDLTTLIELGPQVLHVSFKLVRRRENELTHEKSIWSSQESYSLVAKARSSALHLRYRLTALYLPFPHMSLQSIDPWASLERIADRNEVSREGSGQLTVIETKFYQVNDSLFKLI